MGVSGSGIIYPHPVVSAQDVGGYLDAIKPRMTRIASGNHANPEKGIFRRDVPTLWQWP